MPSRTSALALSAVAALGLATGCEKQNPFVTLTADGVVVKAKAVEYCRPGEDEPRKTDDVPTLKIDAGAGRPTLGIDVPRSLAEQGWRIDELEEEYSYLHYRAIPLRPGATDFTLVIVRDPKHGCGTWRFRVEAAEE